MDRDNNLLNETSGISTSRNQYEDMDTIHTLKSGQTTLESTSKFFNYVPSYSSIKDETINNADTSLLNEISVFDVAKYILKKIGGQCTTMKLHKLLYYSQAWSLVWDDKPLFKEKIEAWANGPVIRELFNFHKGMFEINYWNLPIGNENKLSNEQKETIDAVIDFYGDKSSQWLIDQTHHEAPWIEARRGLSSYERGNNEITLDSMHYFYSSLYAKEKT